MFRVDILEVDNRMLVRLGVEHGPEERAAHAQDQLVRLEDLSAAGQRDVTQLLSPTEVLHHGEEAGVVVIPLEQKLLLIHPVGPSNVSLGVFVWVGNGGRVNTKQTVGPSTLRRALVCT